MTLLAPMLPEFHAAQKPTATPNFREETLPILVKHGIGVLGMKPMRGKRISTTMDIYAQIVPTSQRQALEQLSVFAGGRGVTPQ
jgi:hypothetical protein